MSSASSHPKSKPRSSRSPFVVVAPSRRHRRHRHHRHHPSPHGLTLTTVDDIAEWTFGEATFETISRIINGQDSNWFNEIEEESAVFVPYDVQASPFDIHSEPQLVAFRRVPPASSVVIDDVDNASVSASGSAAPVNEKPAVAAEPIGPHHAASRFDQDVEHTLPFFVAEEEVQIPAGDDSSEMLDALVYLPVAKSTSSFAPFASSPFKPNNIDDDDKKHEVDPASSQPSASSASSSAANKQEDEFPTVDVTAAAAAAASGDSKSSEENNNDDVGMSRVFPVFVFCHGFSGTREQGGIYPRLARALAVRGFASVLFHFRYHTKEQYLRTTLQTQRADVLSVLQFIEQFGAEYGLNANDVNLVGMSQGALVASMAVSSEQHSVKRLILLNPVVNPPVTYSQLFGGLPNMLKALTDSNNNDKENISASAAACYAFGDWPVSSAFIQDLFRFSTGAELCLFTGPALMVVSMEDEIIPQPASVESIARYHSGHTTVVQIPGSNHMFDVFTAEPLSKFLVVDAVISWILKWLASHP